MMWAYTVDYVLYMMWVYTVDYVLYMMWAYTVDYVLYMMWVSTAYTHSICSPRYRAVMPTTYTHNICSPRYMVVISTPYHPHQMYPHHITRHPHYMCYPHHMHMVWGTLTLFPTAYDPRHKLFYTAYTHGIYTPDIPWVYAVDTTCICRGSHMPWVHMSSTDVG